jgi:hypothetical protein
MIIKKLFRNKEEYLDYAWLLINPDREKIWKEEDLPLLEPFFKATSGGKRDFEWTDEIKESFDHYTKCRTEYADDRTEMRDDLCNFDTNDLHAFFFLQPFDESCCDIDDQGNEIDENGNILPPFARESLSINKEYEETMRFPLFFTGTIGNSWTRDGNINYCQSEFVSLSEFPADLIVDHLTNLAK